MEQLNIQIFGTAKCKDTQKAQRFFKEHRIPFHFRDLTVKGISQGELDSVLRSVTIDELMDTDGKQYQKRNLKYILHNPEEELLSDPLLLKTPVVRNGKTATVGYVPEVWLKWIGK